MNSTEIFQMALGLEMPFKVREVSLETNKQNQKSLHIHIGFERGSKFKYDLGELYTLPEDFLK